MKVFKVASVVLAVICFFYLAYANTGSRAECARAEARYESRAMSATCTQVGTCVSCNDSKGMLLDYYYVEAR